MGAPETTSRRNGNGAKSYLIGVLVALVGLLGGVAASELADRSPTRDEVLELIEKTSPYAQDREFVRGNLVDNAAAIKGLDAKLEALQLQVARLETRLEELLGDAIVIQSDGNGG